MAGMEQIEVHSKSYIVRWMKATEGNTISWSLQPHKKSIHVGIFKHPGNVNGGTPNLSAMRASTVEPLGANVLALDASNPSSTKQQPRRPSASGSKDDSTTVTEKLGKLGIKLVEWIGKCEADRVSQGQYDVPSGGSGMYGMVFDNTAAKQFSKTITFTFMTYPTNAPPKSGHHMRHALQRNASSKTRSPLLPPTRDSREYLPQAPDVKKNRSSDAPKKIYSPESPPSAAPSFFTGVLSKKRRKQNQGWARRFFTIDFISQTLSYYKNRNSSALRGAIPLSLAAIGINEDARQISIDSGAEVWVLRAYNQKDFKEWLAVLQKASQLPLAPPTSGPSSRRHTARFNEEEDREWEVVENLVGRVAGITDAVRRLAKDTDPIYSPVYSPGTTGLGIREATASTSSNISPIDTDGGDYFQPDDSALHRRSFWKRSSSNGGHSPLPSGILRRNTTSHKPSSATLAIPSPPASSLVAQRRPLPTNTPHPEEQVHERCIAILHDLDTVVAQFSTLLAETRQKRLPPQLALALATTRNSVDSTRSADFFDAEEGHPPQMFEIDNSQLETSPEQPSTSEVDDSESTSDNEQDVSYRRPSRAGQPSLLPRKPKSLTPLPAEAVKRRTTIPPSSGPPPSLIAFLRKNAGKDLSTLAMPVTANEPLSLLQRQAEELEYSELLDSATTAPSDTGERLLHITAFALSSLSNARVKERAIRKPFNPLLGETFELLREDKGYRFVSEKICHRPVRVASQAESKNWTFTHVTAPSQKFWGKSAELITEGRARVVLHASGDCYSWNPAVCFLRGILAGEKYVEPVQSLTVLEESSGRKAVATFKAGGMFSGRSEDVSVAVYDVDGEVMSMSLEGKWTSHLTLSGSGSGSGKQIWTAGPMVPNPATRYGMTAFAATLNEITALEGADGKMLPPTDSRLRPDQRAYENGEVDEAERMKQRLEEAQRRRRNEKSAGGAAPAEWTPRWFEMVGVDGGEEVWVLKGSSSGGGGGERAVSPAPIGGVQQGYWEVRDTVLKGRGAWEGVGAIFDV